MLYVEGVDPAELQFDSDHAHVEADGLQFTGLIIQLRFLEQFQDTFEFFVCHFHILTGLDVFFFGAVAAGNIVEQAELEVEVFFGSALGDGAVDPSVCFVGAVDLGKLVQHLVQLFSIAGVRLHRVLETSQDGNHLSFQIALLGAVLRTVSVHPIL